MKKTTNFFALVAVMIAFSVTAYSQVGASATADATATIITPIAISHSGADLSFGNVAVNTNPGTVVLTPLGGRSATGGCTLPAGAGTVTAAGFTVTGVAGVVYTITLPASVVITDGTNNMTVNTFTSDPTPTGTLTGGTSALSVGATLNVSGSQVAGIYTSAAPFTVTVNYQ
jgi:hypothetical protein